MAVKKDRTNAAGIGPAGGASAVPARTSALILRLPLEGKLSAPPTDEVLNHSLTGASSHARIHGPQTVSVFHGNFA